MVCPGCAVVSNRVHSRYERSLADTLVGDRPVRIELRIRRLYCENVIERPHEFERRPDRAG
ncbi:transposase family protein [Streptomyces aureus]|uniref:transposase family protein n=1 Tax=Streptomyces aureus TaxID=193461 RepID=UPI002474D940|nr:transposase family protein [Streptomyces aureus]